LRDNAATARAQPLPGVIDCLGSGFSAINRAIWVILIPIALDIALWLAPRLSIAPLVDRWEQLYRSTAAQATAVAPPDAVTRQSMEQASAAFDAVRLVARDFNLLSLLTTNIANAFVPALGGTERLESGSVVDVGSFGAFVGLVVGLQLVGVLLGCLYLVLIAHAVTGERLAGATLVRRTIRAWLNAVGYGLLLLGVALVVAVPLGILVTLVGFVAPSAAQVMYALLFTAAWVAGVWMLLYLYFVTAAIVVGGLGPIRAIVSSIGIVRRHFWASLGLVVLTLVVTLGMGVIWNQLSTQPWGFGAAVVGNAYIASGLMSAGLYYYWQRSGLAGRPEQSSKPAS